MNHNERRTMIERLSAAETPPQPTDLLAKLKSQIPENLASSRRTPPSWWMRIAASTMILLGASWIGIRVWRSSDPMERLSLDAPKASQEVAMQSQRELSAPPGPATISETTDIPPEIAFDGPPAAPTRGSAGVEAARPDNARSNNSFAKRERRSASTESDDKRAARQEIAASSLEDETIVWSQSANAPAVPVEPPPQAVSEPVDALKSKSDSRAATTMRDEAAASSRARPSVGAVVGGKVGGVETSRESRRVSQQSEGMVMMPGAAAPPSAGGSAEPNDLPYGDTFYKNYGVNPFIDTDDDRFSTFGMDVDTGSYAIARRYLNDGSLPPSEAIRVEEFVNSFIYRDPAPVRGDFALYAEAAPSAFPRGDRYAVVRFGIRGRELRAASHKPSVLTFLVDVSGSMARENRLELVKRGLLMMLEELREDDRVGLVVYGSSARLILEPTSDHTAIRDAVASLSPDGATNAEEGLVLAYDVASRHRRRGAINRIILCSDGVANVGATGPDSILKRIERYAREGIELTTIGFGMGNYNDVLMEQLANKGDGTYSYVDTLDEARKVFVENLTGMLQTIAKDAKVQVEFNPRVVARYRLLGYENRDIADERFRDDRVDAGEVGIGHHVTALYEIKFQDSYGRDEEIAALRVRYKSTDSDEEVKEIGRWLKRGDLTQSWRQASPDMKLAFLVATFAETLKESYWSGQIDPFALANAIEELAESQPRNSNIRELSRLAAIAARLRKSSTVEPLEE